MKNALFLQGPNPLFRLALFSILSLVLIFSGQRIDALISGRHLIGSALGPIHYLADAPASGWQWLRNIFQTQSSLTKENAELKSQNQLLSTQLLQLQALKHENQELRELLNSSKRLSNRFAAARLLAVNMSPYKQQIIIGKGKNKGIEQDMPILDEFGVMGRLTRTYALYSEATLISDPNHAIPVRVLRSGIRSIVTGLGRTDRVKVEYLPINSDIQIGDELVTSGLGGKFPADFPVATIKEITRSPASPFAEIYAEPRAKLDQSKEVLIVTSDLSSDRQNSEETQTTPIPKNNGNSEEQ